MKVQRLLASLLPLHWRDRGALLEAAGRVDVRFGAGAADMVLVLFTEARAGRAPDVDADVRALVLALVELLGGAPAEPRLRPRPPAVCAMAAELLRERATW